MDFAELLFDRIGISQDYYSETTHLLKPTEMLITGQLPGLDEDGTVVGFDRETALSRDDVLFLTREHPLLREAMAVVVSSELGNSALGTIKHPKIPAGTVLLECIYGVGPPALEMGRFLDKLQRNIIDPKGVDRGKGIGHEALNRLMAAVPTATAANVMRRIRELLERQLTAADQLAQAALVERKREGLAAVEQQLGGVQRAVLSANREPRRQSQEVEQLSQRMADSRASVDDTRTSARPSG